MFFARRVVVKYKGKEIDVTARARRVLDFVEKGKTFDELLMFLQSLPMEIAYWGSLLAASEHLLGDAQVKVDLDGGGVEDEGVTFSQLNQYLNSVYRAICLKADVVELVVKSMATKGAGR